MKKGLKNLTWEQQQEEQLKILNLKQSAPFSPSHPGFELKDFLCGKVNKL